ncbi:hypothetical protein NQ318_010191 [Aromia moschata]|uniref:Uncharacterized protein n=1 Tax=Aromia moschata TaxID=1265417 RepID=A0AAV8Y0L2_9CUCU|nr:hypothetical protein NQ318_010191 [Aromia moschata]
MGEDKKGKSQKDKGVSTIVEPTRDNTYFSDTDSNVLSPTKSINIVKNELQTVIDLMGPDTPQFLQTTSNDADNEESILSNLSIKFLKKSKTDEDVCVSYTENSTDQTIPPDVTLQEDTDLSKVADKNSSTVDIRDAEYPQYICPPPLLPANVVFNSECMCPQIASYIHEGAISMPCVGAQRQSKKYSKHRSIFYSLFKSLKGKHHEFVSGKREYYSMNIKRSSDDHSPPRRLIFDLVGDIPERDDYQCQCKNPEELKETYFNENYNMKANESKHFQNEQKTYTEFVKNDRLTPLLPRESMIDIDKAGKKLHQKTTYSDHNGTTRVDVYYFDHGNSRYNQ